MMQTLMTMNSANNSNVIANTDIASPIPSGIAEQSFEVDGTQCSVEIKQSNKTRGKFLVILKANIKETIVKSIYATYSCSEEEIRKGKEILVRSAIALGKIFKYNVVLSKNDEDATIIQFDWEKYKAFKETSSIAEFLPEMDEEENCVLSLKNPDALEEYASLLEEEWGAIIALSDTDNLMKFEVKKYKGKFSFLSDKNPTIQGDFFFINNNLSGHEWMERYSDISSVGREVVEQFELEILKKIILA